MEIQGARVREVAFQFLHTFNFMLLKDFFFICILKISYIKGSKSDFMIELAPLCGTKVQIVVSGRVCVCSFIYRFFKIVRPQGLSLSVQHQYRQGGWCIEIKLLHFAY